MKQTPDAIKARAAITEAQIAWEKTAPATDAAKAAWDALVTALNTYENAVTDGEQNNDYHKDSR